MADDNKPLKYARYAIGEIVLVVIGILIAIQINNWNQNRISNKEEQTILLNIHTEFLQNKESLKVLIALKKITFNSSKRIFNLIGQERAQINRHNIDSLLFNIFESGGFRPSENTISDLIQSGRLQLLKNRKLKDLIYLWSRKLKSYENTQNRVELKIDGELIPYLSRKYSMKDIDNYGKLKWNNKTLLSIDKFGVFEDIEFENILDDYIYRLKTSINDFFELDIIINDILKETDTKNDKIL